MENITLADLAAFNSRKPTVHAHGAWADNFRHNAGGYEIKDIVDIREDILTAQINAKPIAVKASTDYVTSVLVETEDGKDTFNVEDENGEHLYLRISKELGTLIFLPTNVKVLHDEDEEGNLIVSQNYWEAEGPGLFLTGVTIDEYNERGEEYSSLRLKSRLRFVARNGVLSVEILPTQS